MNHPIARARSEARAIAIIALPVIVAQLLQMGMGVADTLMAGRVSALALSAVAMGAAMWFFAVIAGLGLMLALTPIISHHVGANNHPLIREELRQGVWLALALSVFQMLTLLVLALSPLASSCICSEEDSASMAELVTVSELPLISTMMSLNASAFAFA